MPHEACNGRVLLVGAGPGAADLLTMRAAEAIRTAGVILFDALVSDEIRALFPASAKAIEVGKRGHRASTSQDFTNRLMVRLARAGAQVVRLKGGDPSIYGRAAEERAYLEATGVAVEVIPGITTATAAAAQFGFSLTARETARRVLFATGRTLRGPAADWGLATDHQTTLCLYMGCGDISAIAQDLVSAGRDPDTPAIATINVSRPDARLVRSTLQYLPAALAGEMAEAPVFICIGDVVAASRDQFAADDLQQAAVRGGFQ